jgi:hypothetical protein
VYVPWSYPGEANRDVTEIDNRFSTMTEVRRVLWPSYEAPEWSDPLRFQQGIAGSLELFFWAWVRFQRVVTEATGYVVPVFQRIDQAGFRLPLDRPSNMLRARASSLPGAARTWATSGPVRRLLADEAGASDRSLWIGPNKCIGIRVDERVLGDTDTLFVFGLDHMVTEQEAAREEIEAVRQFLIAFRIDEPTAGRELAKAWSYRSRSPRPLPRCGSTCPR